jgi:alkylation response protein AidB-like acyl-CoA dehydrogenase
VRGVTALAEGATAEEARAFAATVAAIVSRHAPVDPWRPGAAVSDADPALDHALAEAGWDELATDERLLPLVAPAALELGRSCASLAPVDRLLGGAVRTGELARYAHEGGRLVEPRAGALQVAEALRAVPLPHTDSLGVARVEHGPARALPAGEARLRMAAWSAGSAGYLAGVAAGALRLALDHARSRRAFGGPLTALEPVQQLLADAATLAGGLELLAHDRPGRDALAHAGDAAERAVAICMQVTGALGFTLEFPLQRAHRRARASRSFADAVLLAWDEHP